MATRWNAHRKNVGNRTSNAGVEPETINSLNAIPG
jgi:hypothetical protein